MVEKVLIECRNTTTKLMSGSDDKNIKDALV